MVRVALGPGFTDGRLRHASRIDGIHHSDGRAHRGERGAERMPPSAAIQGWPRAVPGELYLPNRTVGHHAEGLRNPRRRDLHRIVSVRGRAILSGTLALVVDRRR